MALGHYMPWFYTVSTLSGVAWDLAGQPGGWLSGLSDGLSYVSLASILAWLAQHMNFLCERCAAATPLDPEKAVRRRRLMLRLTHLDWFFWILIGIIVAQVAGDHFIPKGPARYAYDAAFLLVVLVFCASTWAHQRLQPWCPWCRWGRGGEHEAVPDPDPAMAL
jgi:hypothetical protein